MATPGRRAVFSGMYWRCWSAAALAVAVLGLLPLPVRRIIFGSMALLIPVVALFYAMTPGVAQVFVDGLAGIGEQLNEMIIRDQPAASDGGSQWQFSCDFQMESSEGEAMLPEEVAPSAPAEPKTVPVWLVGLSIALSIFILVVLLLRRRRRETAVAADATEVTVGKVDVRLWQEIMLWLRSAGRWLWWRLRWLWTGFDRDEAAALQNEAELLPMRRLYRQLLRWSAARGLTRLPGQTPLEFSAVLCEEYPAAETPLRQLTEVYCRARYCRKPPCRNEVDTAFAAWQTISALPPKTPPDAAYTEMPEQAGE